MKFADRIQNPSNSEEQFQKELFEYLDEYEIFLRETKKLSKHTINTRRTLLSAFIEYLFSYHPISGFEDIRFSWCSSGFSGYERGMGEPISTKTSRNYIRDFFVFIHEQHGVANLKLLNKLKTAR